MSDPRQAALEILYRISKSGAYGNIALGQTELSGLDRAFCTELVKGVTERKRVLDAVISKYVEKKPDGKITEILRLGLYQILFLTKVPDHAVCDQSVMLAKKCDRRSGGFVNAVLRNVCRQKQQVKAMIEELPEEIRFSVSDSIYAMIKEQYPGDYTAVFQSFFERKSLCIRANPLKESRYESGICGDADMSDIEKGLFYVQGLASQKAVKALDAQPGMFVLDLCACPGGKTFGAALDMQNKGRIIARDLHKNKLSLIEKGGEKLGITIIETDCRDASVTDEEMIGKADRVICDVPCSGLGVMSSKPEIRYKNAADFGGLYPVQQKILQNALKYLKAGGRAVYSTCTVNRLENEINVHKVLENQTEYVLKSEQTILPGNNYDGFYIAVIERV